MTIVTGGEGFLGSYLVNCLSKEFKVTGTYLKQMPILNKNYIKIDITNINSLKKIEELKPNVIIHCAAIKDVPYCEEHKEEAYNINVDGTKNIIDVCKNINAKLIFISTDYVFKGDKGNYKENDIKEPTTVYGKTKSEAENLIIDSNINYAICRSAGLYIGKDDFVEKVINNLKNNNTFNAFTNIYNSPTYMINLFEMIEEIIKRDLKGIFHTAGSERISKFDFANKIANFFNLNKDLIKKDIDDIRPKDLSLNIEKTQKILDIHFNNVEGGVKRIEK